MNMQDVRHDPDPPPPSSTRENVKAIPPSTPSSFSSFNHPTSAISSSSNPNRRAYFSTPITASSTSTPQRSGATPPIATYSSASPSSLLESPFSQEWPTCYSSGSNATQQHPQVMGGPSSSAASVSPPNIPYLQPVFVSSSNSNKYMDYYVPMNHANSSTESFPYSSDESRYHYHSQQTSEESAQYDNQYTYLSKPVPTWPSSTSSSQRAPASQTTSSSQANAKAVDGNKCSFTDERMDNANYSSKTQNVLQTHPLVLHTSNEAVGNEIPTLGLSEGHRDALPKSVQSLPQQKMQGFQVQQQQRRAADTFFVDNAKEALLLSWTSPSSKVQGEVGLSDSSGMSALSLPAMPRPASANSARGMYHVREDSFASSSADSSVESNPLMRQELHQDGRPKRPLNAFMIYSRARRTELQKERPDLKVRDIATALSVEWNALDKEGRAKYLEMARVVKETFHRTYPSYVYTRRANGARSKKKATAALKASLKRSKNSDAKTGASTLRDSDESPFSPEGYTSSASSTSSFTFARPHSSPLDFAMRRPVTSASQSSSFTSERFAIPALPQSSSQSRRSTPPMTTPISSQEGYLRLNSSDPIASDYSVQDNMSSSGSPQFVIQGTEWPASASFPLDYPSTMLCDGGLVPPYTAPLPTTSWSGPSSSNFQPMIPDSLSANADMQISTSFSQAMYSPQQDDESMTWLRRSTNRASSSLPGDDSIPYAAVIRSGTPASFSPPSPARVGGIGLITNPTSFSGLTGQYRSQMNVSSSSPPFSETGPQAPLPQRSLATVPNRAKPYSVPTPALDKDARGIVFPNHTLPSTIQSMQSGYDMQTSSPNQPVSLSNQKELPEHIQPVLPLRLPSGSDLNFTPLSPADFNLPLGQQTVSSKDEGSSFMKPQ